MKRKKGCSWWSRTTRRKNSRTPDKLEPTGKRRKWSGKTERLTERYRLRIFSTYELFYVGYSLEIFKIILWKLTIFAILIDGLRPHVWQFPHTNTAFKRKALHLLICLSLFGGRKKNTLLILATARRRQEVEKTRRARLVIGLSP